MEKYVSFEAELSKAENATISSAHGSQKSLARQPRVYSLDDSGISLLPNSSANELLAIDMPSTSNDDRFLRAETKSGESPSRLMRKSSWLQAVRTSVLGPEDSLSILSVARNLHQTGSNIKKKRADLVYLFMLIFYSIAGAFLFQWLDGDYDNRMIETYNTRCNSGHRNEALRSIQMNYCNEGQATKCFQKMKAYLEEIEHCYIRWHEVNKSIAYSNADFMNSLVYAFSIYTTIGWGNIAADTTACRAATVLYGIIGIPLFFAFAKEAGLYFRSIFINLFEKFAKWFNRKCCRKGSVVSIKDGDSESDTQRNKITDFYCDQPDAGISNDSNRKIRKLQRQNSSLSMSGEDQLEERRRVFVAGIVVLIVYLFLNSLILELTTEFDFVTAVYFSFTSVATIGFGDEFPKNPIVLLYNAMFIAIGLVLFSMCYFILQEEIRTKASEASRKARKSISKYSNVVIQQAKGQWSRRNSPHLIIVTDAESSMQKHRKRRQSAPTISALVKYAN